MHEYSIVQSLFEQIRETARREGAVAVRRVRVQIGEIAGVDTELLATAYELFRERTICDGAPLEIEAIPARWGCPGGHGEIVKGRALICPQCGEPARLDAGDEILLRQLELEVP
jgi:hydrogenase nickel incorporation protein HypA/HybF